MTTLKSLLLRFYNQCRKGSRGSPVREGYCDPCQYDEIIGKYRNLGATIGKNVRMVGRIDSMNPHLVTIGDFSVIGSGSTLLAHCPVKGAAPCRVGNFAYIGYGVIVLPGVTIGDYTIVGAGSVVTRDLPAGVIAAGNPARVIRQVSETEKNNLVETMTNFRLFRFDAKLNTSGGK